MRSGVSGTSAVVVTATTGEPLLAEAIASVQRQTWRSLRHLVVADGPDAEEPVRAILRDVKATDIPVDLLVLPTNTGHSSFYGHRIFAAMSFVVDEDVIFLLDADNCYDDVHVASCMHALAWSNRSWCYSLRRLILPDGTYLCDDDAESLGHWMRYIAYLAGTGLLSDDEDRFYRRYKHLVDTSCFSVRREPFMRWAPAWYYDYRADAVFTKELLENEEGVTTGRVSVSYRLAERNLERTSEYYLDANEFMRERFKDDPLPWRAKGVAPGIVPPRSLLGTPQMPGDSVGARPQW